MPLNAFACSLPAAQSGLAPAQRRGHVWDAAERRGARADVSEASQQALGFHHLYCGRDALSFKVIRNRCYINSFQGRTKPARFNLIQILTTLIFFNH